MAGPMVLDATVPDAGHIRKECPIMLAEQLMSAVAVLILDTGEIRGVLLDMRVVGEAADGDEAIAQAIKLQPNVVLMDLSMPHGKDGLSATAELKKQVPDAAVLILTSMTMRSICLDRFTLEPPVTF
jgi:DNA-binding NarL/FixJ family response regulator